MKKEIHSRIPIKIQDFLDIAGVMFVALDANGKVSLINRKGCEILGYAEDEIIGKDWFSNFLPENVRKEVRQEFDKLIKGKIKPPDYYTNPVLSKNGEQKLIAFHNNVLRDENEKIIGTLSSGEDITGKEKTLELLNKERAIFKAIVDNIPVMITRYDPQQKMIYLNKEFEKKIGWKTEEVKEIDLMEKVYPDPDYRLMVSKYMQKAAVEWREFKVKAKSGEIVDSEWSNIKLEDGTQIGIGIDVRQRKKAEENLRKSEERYRALFDRSLDFVFIHDFQGNFIDANKSALEKFGFSKEEIKCLNFSSLLADKSQVKEIKNVLKELKDTGRQKEITQFKLKTKSGKIIWVETKSSVIHEDGKPKAIQGIGRDITKRKQAEMEIKKRLKEKEVMLQEIHHRVKNNMQIIISLLRLQSSQVRNKKYLELFKSSQNRIYSMALIHEKLYQSKDFARVDFSKFLESFVIHLFNTYKADPNKIELKLELDDIKIDINRAIPLALLLNELVSNVLKHAFPEGEKGMIFIKLSRVEKGKKIILVIKDNGLGIPEGLDVKTPKTLGLQLINDLVKQINGKIYITKKEGTEIKITF